MSLSARAKQLAADGRGVLNFTIGEPDFDTPDYIKEAGKRAIDDGFTKYTPSSGTLELREMIREKLKRDNGIEYAPNQIVVSNGAKHALSNVFMSILDEGDECLLPAPYWLSYSEQIRFAGGVDVPVYTEVGNNYRVTPDMLEPHVTPRTKALLINSPNNPTGMVYSEEDLRAIAAFAEKHDLFIVSDEIYEKLVYDGARHVSPASFGADAYARTIVINGFSKTYAMTGWRVGYSACSPELAEIIGNIQSHLASNPNSIAQKAAAEALRAGDSAISAMVHTFHQRRDRIYALLADIPGISIVKPEGAFYAFVDVSGFCAEGSETPDAAAFAAKLLDEEGVAVVPCADFGYPKHIRMTYAVSTADIDEGAARLKRFIAGSRRV
jgi:aspartate aminotransferase